MENLEIYGVMAVPLVAALVQVGTTSGISKKYAPILSLIIGVLIGIIGFSDGNIIKGIIIGTAIGLSASGFYSNLKIKKGGEK